MKTFKKITSITIISIIMVSFSNCASTQKLEQLEPLTIGEVHYQNWVAGIKGGGSGFNLFIPITNNPKNIMLDSVYFRGKKAKLELNNNTVFIGRFKTTANKNGIIMSNEPYAEYGNKVPELPQKTPFELNDNECVVSYLEGNKIKYFKIEGIVRKESKLYQKAPSKKL